MKKPVYFKIAALAWIIALFACTKNFDSINSNPNAPENVPATNLLLSAITDGIFGIVNTDAFGLSATSEGSDWRTSAFWIQHLTKYLSAPAQDSYGTPWGNYVAPWNLYSGPLQDLQAILDNPENGPNMKAAATVLRAYLFAQMTDLLGDVPYAQALNVNDYAQPKYDTQESIYKDLTAQLAQAAAQFDGGRDALGAGDVLYYGDTDKWIKFANSLRARLLNHYKHLDPQANADLQQLLSAAPVFESHADNAQLLLNYPNTHASLLYNPPGAGKASYGISASMVDMLASLGDPRLPVYAQPNVDGLYVGNVNGDYPPDLSLFSDMGTVYRDDPNFPVVAMTYDELLFIKAEALHDKQAYLDGIAAAMDAYGLAPDPAYLSNAAAAFDADWLKAIITQKWIAFYAKNSIEAFNDYRRTGYPVLQPSTSSIYPGRGIPTRYAYPAYEDATNGANVNAARAAQHINLAEPIYGDKMWWAK